MDNKPQWSHWCWGNTGICRHSYSDWRIEAVHFPAVERRESVPQKSVAIAFI